jgi:hypothetical protein
MPPVISTSGGAHGARCPPSLQYAKLPVGMLHPRDTVGKRIRKSRPVGTPSGPATGSVGSALVAMEALIQPRHIKVRGRFYVARFFDRETGMCWLAPFQRFRWTRQVGSLAGQPARQPCNG